MTAAAASRASWREADYADRARYSQAAWRNPTSTSAERTSGAPSAHPAAPGSHYELIGVARGASAADIRRAYRRRLVTAHPDKGGDPAAFQALQAAFAVLSDPDQRLIYDERLEMADGSRNGSSRAAGRARDGSCSGHMPTAVVHGQTDGRRAQDAQQQQQQCSSSVQQAACAGQPGGGSEELQAATAAIRALRAGRGSKSGGAGALAAAHLRRAELHLAAGALHHALFDAEEAARLQPGNADAAALAARLAAAQQTEQQPGAAMQPDGAPSDDSDLDF